MEDPRVLAESIHGEDDSSLGDDPEGNHPEENHPDPTLPSISRDEAESLIDRADATLSSSRPFDKSYYSLFGKRSLDAIVEVLKDPSVCELDRVWMCDGLSHEAFTQYLSASSHGSLRLRLLQIARDIVAALFPKIPRYIERSTAWVDTGDRKYDLETRQFLIVQKPQMKEENNFIVRLYSMINTFLDHLKIPDPTSAYRTILLNNFAIDIVQLLTLRIEQHYDENSSGALVFREVVERLEHFHEELGSHFPGFLALHSIGYVDSQLVKFPHAKDFFLSAAEPLSDDATLQKQFGEIVRLSLEKRVGRFPRDSSGNFVPEKPPIVTYGDRYFPDFMRRAQSIAIARIGLDPALPFTDPELVTRSNGSQFLKHYGSDGSIELYLDRHTGELCFVGTNIPLPESCLVASSEYDGFYPVLKTLVYRHLLRYLEEEATRSMTDHFFPEHSGLDGGSGDVVGSTEDLVDSTGDLEDPTLALREALEVAEIFPELSSQGDNGHVRDGQAASDTAHCASDLLDSDGDPLVQPVGAFCTASDLRSLHPRQVYRVLDSLLGKPRKGRHFVYNDDDGRAFPLPHHISDTDINSHILSDLLKRFRITREQFFRALGRKR